ncbi:ScbA/BarX family gamma-butyrolactone biosynthesis protein [Actinoplanes sp. NPDC020271]|uniref:ScbA/BarX family gamma-butyrolactone biosynthesis protein n=1 Tax=Actinoplanes sp. NPDC020271 TaxID=3363896 RepID=UPI00379D0A32
MTSRTAEISTDIRSLVRKDRPGEVLVAGWTELPGLVQQVNVRWPKHHTFYREGSHYTPLLFTESLRQALALVSNQVHQIPLGHRLGWEQIRSWIVPSLLEVQDCDTEIIMVVSHPSVTRRRMGSAHLVSHVYALKSGQAVGGAELHWSAYPPAIYNRLRGQYASAPEAFARALPLTPPVSPALVGRRDPANVVLSPTERPGHWQLRVDTGNGVLFDHPHDHVPGMVLLEAAAQAAQACLPGPVLTSAFDTQFVRYVELDQPCYITAVPGLADADGRTVVQVNAVQRGNSVLTTTVTTESSPN